MLMIVSASECIQLIYTLNIIDMLYSIKGNIMIRGIYTVEATVH